MPKVKIEDIFQAELWTDSVINEAPELKNILNSGILRTGSELESVVNAAAAGSRFELPYVDEPDYTEPNAMDDSDNEIPTEKVAWANQFAILGLYSKGYKHANIVNQIKRDNDPAMVLRDIIGNFWGRDLQRRIVAALTGIAQKAGDALTLDVADDTADGAEKILDASVMIDGASLLGDHQDKFGFLFVHSKVYADLKKQNLIETVVPSEAGAEPIQMYGNWRVIVNDMMPVVEGENKKKYTSIVAQTGIFAYAQKNLGDDMPILEVARNPLKGLGAGDTTLISRRGFVLHPVGWSYGKSTMSPTLADLKNPTNWAMKFKPKQQKFVRIVTN